MVLPGSERYQRRRPLSRAHPGGQPRPSRERHPQEPNPLCLSELARAYPTPKERRVASAKHDLLHRLKKRLWRFTDNERVDPLAVQLALVPHTVACLGFPRLLGLAIDWTMFDTALPCGQTWMRYQVLRIAVPRKGRALPLFATGLRPGRPEPEQEPEPDRTRRPLLALVGALPMVGRASRGLGRQGLP